MLHMESESRILFDIIILNQNRLHIMSDIESRTHKNQGLPVKKNAAFIKSKCSLNLVSSSKLPDSNEPL